MLPVLGILDALSLISTITQLSLTRGKMHDSQHSASQLFLKTITISWFLKHREGSPEFPRFLQLLSRDVNILRYLNTVVKSKAPV